MPQPEVNIENGGNTRLNGNTQIVLNLKAISVIVGLIITVGSSVFGLVNRKLNNIESDFNTNQIELKGEINKLDQSLDEYKQKVTTVQSQNTIILQYYGIDLTAEAAVAAEARREDGRPSDSPGQ